MVSSISGSAIQYAGGGGGGSTISPYNPLVFGLGGGGGGGNGGGGATASTSTPAQSGIANTGGGGGGGASNDFRNATGGAGGSGIVVLRYPSYLKQAASTTGSPTYYQALGYNVYIFYASGTITF